MSSSSGDSDAGEQVKNLQSFLIKSESNHVESDDNCAYKQKLGDLIFNANFEAGNLGYVERIDEYEYDLMVRPDVSNPRHRVWFNFTVSNQRPEQCVIFTFTNLSDELSLFNEGLAPVVRSRLHPNWLRLHEDQVFYYRSRNHGNFYVLSLAFRFSNYDDEHQFALFYPYCYTNLISTIGRWRVELKRKKTLKSPLLKAPISPSHARPIRISPDCLVSRQEKLIKAAKDEAEPRTRSSQGFVSRSKSFKNYRQDDSFSHVDADFEAVVLGKSTLSKSIYLLSVRSTEELNRKKPLVIVLSRTRGNLDSVASFVCQGLFDYVLSDHLVAEVARRYMNFHIFPMIDPDSIWAGNSRTDLTGQTRISAKFFKANKSLYTNLALVYDQVNRLCQADKSCRVILLELKVNLNLIGSRTVGTYYEDSLRMERHLSFPRLLARFTNDFYLERCRFLKSPAAGGGSQQYNLPVFDFKWLLNVDQYRFEVSPFAFYKRSLNERSYQQYDPQKYLSLGKAIVYSLTELLRPKDQKFPDCAGAILESFHPRADDIDELMLKSRNESGHMKGTTCTIGRLT